MTISLRTRSSPKARQSVIPVATEATFDEHWRPACDALGLTFVSLFQGSGINLDAESAGEVVEELCAVLGWMVGTKRPKTVIERVIAVREQLRKVASKPTASAYVG